ncbi:MAG: S41 family peptidase, partial [Chitinophagales bacterium]|nr:S41 family peptidase [Chitinophagales bacterium]
DDVDPNKLMRKGIDAMLNDLDPYTDFISEADIEDYRFMTSGKYGGIGSLIATRGEYVIVSEPYEGFPADRAGLKAGDIFLEIDGKSVKGKKTDDVSKVLKGQPGTKVKVLIKRPQADGSEKEMTFDLDREEIKIKNVPYYGMVNDKTGYIVLSNFTENAGDEVRNALKELKSKHKPESVILDLRGNPGGLLHEAVNISNVFIDKNQEICTTKGKVEEWLKSFKTNNNAEDTEIPLCVLVNGGSASASEIVSGSIQDLDRGVVVGTRTFGKGLVQSTRNLPYNTKLKVTTAKYYIPSGRCIQAINYAEKNADGSVKKVPDSLKVSFKTKNGRIVYDGGGIDPDAKVERPQLSKLAISLITKNFLFDYATKYYTTHPKIKPPREFSLSDEEFKDFVKFLEGKEYDYTTETEDMLKKFKDKSSEEKYFEAIKGEFDALQAKLRHDKTHDIDKAKDEIKELLENEIIVRYYYNKGRLEHNFKYDEEIQKALSILSNKAEYQKLITKK